MQRLRSLPESYREPLLLRAMNGMRSRQIAEILAIEPATVDTRIARARRMLQEATGGEPNLANNGVASGDEKEEYARDDRLSRSRRDLHRRCLVGRTRSSCCSRSSTHRRRRVPYGAG